MLLSLIFSSGRHSAADMAFFLILLEHYIYLLPKHRIIAFETFGNVFMYRRFAYFELLGCGSYGRIVFNNIFTKYYCALINCVPHTINSIRIAV